MRPLGEAQPSVKDLKGGFDALKHQLLATNIPTPALTSMIHLDPAYSAFNEHCHRCRIASAPEVHSSRLLTDIPRHAARAHEIPVAEYHREHHAVWHDAYGIPSRSQVLISVYWRGS